MERRDLLCRGVWPEVCPSSISTSDVLTSAFRFERELERLRKELELASATGTTTTSAAATPSVPSSPFPLSPDGPHTEENLTDGLANSPLILPGTRDSAAEMEVPDLILDKAVIQHDDERKKTV